MLRMSNEKCDYVVNLITDGNSVIDGASLRLKDRKAGDHRLQTRVMMDGARPPPRSQILGIQI